jgi:hypothetical protein
MKGRQGAVQEDTRSSKISAKFSHNPPSKNPPILLVVTIQLNRSDSDEGRRFTRTGGIRRICQNNPECEQDPGNLLVLKEKSVSELD